jgi:hypothetical protein
MQCTFCQQKPAAIRVRHGASRVPYPLCSKDCSNAFCQQLLIGPPVKDDALMPVPPADWNQLSDEMKLAILGHVPILRLLPRLRTGAEWKAVAADEQLWHSLYQQYPVAKLGAPDRLVLPTWRGQTVEYLRMFDHLVGLSTATPLVASSPDKQLIVFQEVLPFHDGYDRERFQGVMFTRDHVALNELWKRIQKDLRDESGPYIEADAPVRWYTGRHPEEHRMWNLDANDKMGKAQTSLGFLLGGERLYHKGAHIDIDIRADGQISVKRRQDTGSVMSSTVWEKEYPGYEIRIVALSVPRLIRDISFSAIPTVYAITDRRTHYSYAAEEILHIRDIKPLAKFLEAHSMLQARKKPDDPYEERFRLRVAGNKYGVLQRDIDSADGWYDGSPSVGRDPEGRTITVQFGAYGRTGERLPLCVIEEYPPPDQQKPSSSLFGPEKKRTDLALPVIFIHNRFPFTDLPLVAAPRSTYTLILATGISQLDDHNSRLALSDQAIYSPMVAPFRPYPDPLPLGPEAGFRFTRVNSRFLLKGVELLSLNVSDDPAALPTFVSVAGATEEEVDNTAIHLALSLDFVVTRRFGVASASSTHLMFDLDIVKIARASITGAPQPNSPYEFLDIKFNIHGRVFEDGPVGRYFLSTNALPAINGWRQEWNANHPNQHLDIPSFAAIKIRNINSASYLGRYFPRSGLFLPVNNIPLDMNDGRVLDATALGIANRIH